MVGAAQSGVRDPVQRQELEDAGEAEVELRARQLRLPVEGAGLQRGVAPPPVGALELLLREPLEAHAVVPQQGDQRVKVVVHARVVVEREGHRPFPKGLPAADPALHQQVEEEGGGAARREVGGAVRQQLRLEQWVEV